jgi:hypothetical protein
MCDVGEKRKAYRVFVGKPKRERTLRIPWRRWEDNIGLDID